MAGGVGDLVDRVDRLGDLAGDEAQRLAGGEGAAVGGVGLLREFRFEGELAAVRVGVVLQHRDGDDVARTDGCLVGFGLRRLQLGRRGDDQDGDLPARGGLAVGDCVLDVELALGPEVGDPDDGVVQDGDAERQSVRRGHGLDHQDAAGGVRVVAEDVHQHAAAGRQQRGVAHGHRCSVAAAGDDVDPDQLLGAGRSVGDEVGDVVGALGGGVEGEGLLVGAHGGGGVAVRGGLGETERPALRVRVIFERGDHGVHAGDGHDVVGVRDRRQGSRRAHLHGDLAFGRGPAVGDGDGDGLASGFGAGVLEAEQAVGPDFHLVAGVAACSADDEQVIAVGVGPVGEDVLADRFAGLDHECGVPVRFLPRGGVLPGRDDVERDVGGGGEAAAVVDRVFERFRPGLVRADADLEAGGAVDRSRAARI